MTRTWRGPLIFFGYPILEIAVVVWVASLIGWAWTFVILLVGLGAGLAVMRWAGMNAFRALTDPAERTQAFSQVNPETGEQITIHPAQELSPEDVAEAARGLRESGLLFAGGSLLAIPGFISDLVGLVLIFPPTRQVIASRMAARSARRPGTVVVGETVIVDDEGVHTTRWQSGGADVPEQPTGDNQIIQGEILPPKPRDPEDR